MKTAVLLLVGLSAAAVAGAAQRPVPSHDGGTGRPPAREVARVNGVRIMSDRLDVALAALIPMESFHRNVSPEKRAELRKKALDSLVDEELTFQEGQRQHVTVSEAEIKAVWDESARRYGGGARFSEALRQSGASEPQVRAEFRRTATIRKTLDREVTVACSVSRTQAEQFFAANPNRFVEPEGLRIEAVTVGVDPSSSDEQRKAAKARAEQARSAITGGLPFADAVSQYSTDQSGTSGGDLGFVHRGSLTEAFEQVAKTLRIGQPSDVVETLYGYHIIRVTEIRPARARSFSEVGVALQNDLTASRCAERRDTWLAGLRAKADIDFMEGP